jgi:outer membrane protein assembly factor BamB
MRNPILKGALAAAIVAAAASLAPHNAMAQAAAVIDPRDDQFAVAYQINPAHTGAITLDKTFRPPLKTLWNVTAEGPISYPLIARGKVFVWVSHFSATGNGGRLYALDKDSGTIVWLVDFPSNFGGGNITYDRGRVFVITDQAIVHAFDADSGSEAWTARTGQPFSSTVPTASNGTLYIVSNGSGGTLSALDEESGNALWTQSQVVGDSAPTVSGEGVFTSDLDHVSKFNPTTGEPVLGFGGNCDGGITPISAVAVYYRGRLYDSTETDCRSSSPFLSTIFDANTFKALGNFGPISSETPPPAFQGSIGYRIDPATKNLVAMNLDGGELWSAGDGALFLGPLVVNDAVYALSRAGVLFAFNRATGEQLWTANAGGAVPFLGLNPPLSGIAAGEGVLVVPVGFHLFALGSAGEDDE